jgi:hypothetical protein
MCDVEIKIIQATKLRATKHLKLINSLRVFLTWTLDGDELIPGNEPPFSLNTRFVCLRAGWYVFDYGKTSFLLPEVVQPFLNLTSRCLITKVITLFTSKNYNATREAILIFS